MDYPSSSHHKPNHCTRHLRPIASHAPVHPPFARSTGHPLHLYLQCVSSNEVMHSGTVVLPVTCLQFSRIEASLGTMLHNIRRPYIHINTHEGDPISSILALPSLPVSHNTAPWTLQRGWLPAALGTIFLRRSSPSSPQGG
jgi:hypothetical protein